jgi:epoxyqueuosine reductase
MSASGVPLDAYRRLVLIGHGGRRMWEAVQAQGMQPADPIDDYSTARAQRFISAYLDGAPHLWLYPNTAYLIPLQQLGEAAGWSHPSPIGSGISPLYGVWFAYRAAFLIDADLPLVHEEPASSPCASCLEKPCISACPVGAVRLESFDIDACVQHRLLPQSPCADRCLARLACPYFPQHRYSEPQIQYHYGRSLEALRAWRADNH